VRRTTRGSAASKAAATGQGTTSAMHELPESTPLTFGN